MRYMYFTSWIVMFLNINACTCNNDILLYLVLMHLVRQTYNISTFIYTIVYITIVIICLFRSSVRNVTNTFTTIESCSIKLAIYIAVVFSHKPLRVLENVIDHRPLKSITYFRGWKWVFQSGEQRYPTCLKEWITERQRQAKLEENV